MLPMVAGNLSLSRSDYSAVARGKASGRHPGSVALPIPHPGGRASNDIIMIRRFHRCAQILEIKEVKEIG